MQVHMQVLLQNYWAGLPVIGTEFVMVFVSLIQRRNKFFFQVHCFQTGKYSLLPQRVKNIMGVWKQRKVTSSGNVSIV
jgi:hypothetical protein